jgi:proteasome lid subunit RPN8/RPN11
MALRLTERQLEFIRQHSSRNYPSECCGVLLGHVNERHKEVIDAVALKNLRQEDAARSQELLPLQFPGAESERNRFLIDPKDQIGVEKDARARGLEVLGYYHSHPDHPARPSTYDRDHAWPWYSYVIISVEQGKTGELNSWVLADDGSRFEAEPVEVLKP